jgi:hypothetical protein
MADKFYTIAGAAEYKGVTYPTIKNAITKGKLKPITANPDLKEAQEVKLLTQTQLDNWTKQKSRLTDEQRIERAAKLFGGIEQMKAALAKKGK